MKNLMSFESFTTHVKAQQETKVTEEQSVAQKSSAAAYENLLKKFNVSSPAELTEDAKASFVKELFSAKPANEAKINEADIKSDDDFREYVTTILKQQHPDDFDPEIAKDVADGLLAKKKGNDYGPLIGMLNKA